MNPTRTPFRQMRETVSILQVTVLPILATLKVESLDDEKLKLVTTIVFAREHTAQQLKTNLSRAKMLVLCLAWYRLAEMAKTLIPDDQPALLDALKAVMDEVAWVKELNPNMKIPEVQH